MDIDAQPRDELVALLKQAAGTIKSLQGEVDALRSEVTMLKAEVVTLKSEIERLNGGPPSSVKSSVPAFVKANVKPRPKAPRKKREHGFARRRQSPTQTVEHFPEACSCCGRKLSGGWLHRTKELIELPLSPIEVIEHRIMARYCGVCGKRTIASADLSDTVVGRSRLGARLMSLIAYLDTVCRMPIRLIQRLLHGQYGLHLSVGEICRVLHTAAKKGRSAYNSLLQELRASSVVNADETGWRENGKNGYCWSFSTPGIHYYLCQRNRSGDVVREVLEDYNGALVTDFYSAYHYYRGPHQYCWPHLLRDIHELKQQHAEDPILLSFAQQVQQVYEDAKLYTHPSVFARQRKRSYYEKKLSEVARNHLEADRPERVLAERILKRIHGLFVFVQRPEVPSHNNAAERSVRPLVVLRKVSGGTRSDVGSNTVAVLMSLFQTWHVRNQDALLNCQQMLTGGSTTIGAVTSG